MARACLASREAVAIHGVPASRFRLTTAPASCKTWQREGVGAGEEGRGAGGGGREIVRRISLFEQNIVKFKSKKARNVKKQDLYTS